MTTISRRTGDTVSDVLGWLEGDPPFGFRGFGLTPYVRVEDFVEDGAYVMRAEMPGIDPDKDIEVKVDGDVLTVRGERREEQKHRRRHEFHYGSFERSVRLPKGAKTEDVKASYVDGVLELRVPIDGNESEARTIPVQRPEA